MWCWAHANPCFSGHVRKGGRQNPPALREIWGSGPAPGSRGWCLCAHKCRDIQKRAKQIIREILLRGRKALKGERGTKEAGRAQMRCGNRRCWTVAVQPWKTLWIEQWILSTSVSITQKTQIQTWHGENFLVFSPFLSKSVEKEEVKWSTCVKRGHFGRCILVF